MQKPENKYPKACYTCGSTEMEDREYFCSAECGLEYAVLTLEDNSASWCYICGEWNSDTREKCPHYIRNLPY